MDFAFVESEKDHGRDCFVYTGHSDLDLMGVENLRGLEDHDRFGLPRAGQEQDAFAPHTTHMLVMVEGELVAGAELVAYSPLGLPLSEWPALRGVLRHSGRLVQCRRPVIRPEFAVAPLPELPFGALGGLLKGCLQWAVFHDVSDVVVELADGRSPKRLAELGFTAVEGSGPVGAPRTYRLNVSRLVARSFRASHPFYRYLLEYDKSVLIGEADTAVA
ncbi:MULTISPECIES: hypothetical protein [Streptomyces]|uniref:GNAT family N-acetyltransferase n=1 Tax=Streptomyces triticiradicis TaxID=2651189 RepID=A0A7J5DJY2_9ACTN|nr:hypothetical protein [Streptomyces triticiradicis]KAB1989003.1 hypothetical protein F8144_10750 [Streptomyces triticiradicis]